MIVALHRPDGVTVFAECLSRICSHTCINQHRYGIDVQGESTHIIMIMAFIIEAAFCCQEPTGLIRQVAEFRSGYQVQAGMVWAATVFSNSPFHKMDCKERKVSFPTDMEGCLPFRR